MKRAAEDEEELVVIIVLVPMVFTLHDAKADNGFSSDRRHQARLFQSYTALQKLSENTYAYSPREIDKETGTNYAYGYMRVLDDNGITTDEPYCTDFDRTELEKLGVEITKPNEDMWTPALCKISSVEVLKALLRSYLNDPKNAENIKRHDAQSTMRITAK